MKLFLILCAFISTIPLSTEAMHSTQGHYKSHGANRLERIKNAKQEACNKLISFSRQKYSNINDKRLIQEGFSRKDLDIIDDVLDIIAKALGKEKPYSKADLLSKGNIDIQISDKITEIINVFMRFNRDFVGIQAVLEYYPEIFYRTEGKDFLFMSLRREVRVIEQIRGVSATIEKCNGNETYEIDNVYDRYEKYSNMSDMIISALGKTKQEVPCFLYEDCTDCGTNFLIYNILYVAKECNYLIPISWELSWRERYRRFQTTVIPGVFSCITKKNNKLILYRKDAIILYYMKNTQAVCKGEISSKEILQICISQYNGSDALSCGMTYKILNDQMNIMNNTIVVSMEDVQGGIVSDASLVTYISNSELFDKFNQHIKYEELEEMEALIVPLKATPLEILEDNIQDREMEFVNLYNEFIEKKNLLTNYSDQLSATILENIYSVSNDSDKDIEVLQQKFKELKDAIAEKIIYQAEQEDLGNDVNIEESGQKKEKSPKEKKQYIHQYKGAMKKCQSLNPKIRQQQIYEQAEKEAKEMLEVRLTTKERNRQAKKLLSEEEQKFFNKPLKVKDIRRIFNDLSKTHSVSGNARTGSSHQRITVDGEHHTIVRPHNSNSEADSRTRSTVMSLSSMAQQ